eukprot:748231_1
MLKHAALFQLSIIIRFILFLTPISTLTSPRSLMDKKECLFCIQKSTSLENSIHDDYGIGEDSCDVNEYRNKEQARETIIHMLTVDKVPSDKILITTLDPDFMMYGVPMSNYPKHWIGSNFHLLSDSICTEYMKELSPIAIYTEINKRKHNTDMVTDWFLRTESEGTADPQMPDIAQLKAQILENLVNECFLEVSSARKQGDCPSESEHLEENTYSSERDEHTINNILSKDIKHKITSFVGPTATNQDNDATSDKATNCGCPVWDYLKCC